MSEPLKGGFSSFTAGTAFKPPGTTGTPPPSTNVFGNTATPASTGASSQTTSTPSAFGGGASSGGNMFGGFGAKPATGPLFGGGTTGTTSATGGGTNPFSGFGANPSAASGTQNPSATPAGGGSASAPGGGLFGAKPPEQQTNASASGSSNTPQPSSSVPLFGGSGGTTPVTQPTSNATPAATSATPNLFGKPTEATTSTPSPAPGASGSASAGASTGAPLFGNGNLFGKKPEAPSVSSTAATGTAPAAPPLFNAFGAKKDDGVDKDKQKDGSPAPAAAGVLFGQPPANKAASAGATGTTFNLFGQKPAEKKDAPAAAPAASSSGTTASDKTPGVGNPANPGISVPPPSMLRGKTIEEIVNKWSSELETHVREFNRLAGEIAVWDRALIDNGNTIAALLQHVMMAEREQSDVEQSLKHVEDQQKELASTLEVYEKAAGEIFDVQGGGLRALDVGPADAERDKHYTLAAELNANLDDLSQSLLQMIESVNSLSESDGNTVGDGDGKTRGDAPLEQIAQILSSHLESLQWIDSAVKEVENKVTDVERLVRDASVNGTRSSGGTGAFSASANGTRPNGLRGSRGFGLR